MIRFGRGFVTLLCILGAVVALVGAAITYMANRPEFVLVTVGRYGEVTAREAMFGGGVVMIGTCLLLQVALQITDRGGWPPPPGRRPWRRRRLY